MVMIYWKMSFALIIFFLGINTYFVRVYFLGIGIKFNDLLMVSEGLDSMLGFEGYYVRG